MAKDFYTDKELSTPLKVAKDTVLLESVMVSSKETNKPIGVVRCLKDTKKDSVFISKLVTDNHYKKEFAEASEKIAVRLLKEWRK
jgi:hypothetical protein